MRYTRMLKLLTPSQQLKVAWVLVGDILEDQCVACTDPFGYHQGCHVEWALRHAIHKSLKGPEWEELNKRLTSLRLERKKLGRFREARIRPRNERG